MFRFIFIIFFKTSKHNFDFFKVQDHLSSEQKKTLFEEIHCILSQTLSAFNNSGKSALKSSPHDTWLMIELGFSDLLAQNVFLPGKLLFIHHSSYLSLLFPSPTRSSNRAAALRLPRHRRTRSTSPRSSRRRRRPRFRASVLEVRSPPPSPSD
jgi:hypothetical protein